MIQIFVPYLDFLRKFGVWTAFAQIMAVGLVAAVVGLILYIIGVNKK